MRVNKTWVINGVTYYDPAQPTGYSGSALVDGVTQGFGSTASGFVEGQEVSIGENDPTIPAGCSNTPSGDLGTKTLTKGANVFTITNTVTCAADVTVLKHWVINGKAYDGAAPLAGYSATLTLGGADKVFGTTYSGYVEGQKVIVDEKYSVPDGCTNVKSGDGEKTLAKGANSYTITNTVTCAATVTVLKTWTINGDDFVDGQQPAGYSTAPTIGGPDPGVRHDVLRLRRGPDGDRRRDHAGDPRRLREHRERRRREDPGQGRQHVHPAQRGGLRRLGRGRQDLGRQRHDVRRRRTSRRSTPPSRPSTARTPRSARSTAATSRATPSWSARRWTSPRAA